MKLEVRDLYDSNKSKTGLVIKKGEVIPKGYYIIVVSIIIQNSDNKFLIEKRSSLKGGKYGFVSGHPKKGENSVQGIISEANEEIGLKLKKNDIALIKEGEEKNKFYDIYYTKKDIDINTLKIQKEEVSQVKFCSKDEIKNLIDNNNFFENHIDIFNMIENEL